MSLTQRHLKDLRALRYKKYRLLQDRYMVEGARLVGEALQSTRTIEQVLASNHFIKSDLWPAIRTTIVDRQLTASTITDDQAMQLSSTQHPQGIFAVLKLPRSIDDPAGTLQPPVLILDDIADPGNLGTLLRTADWFAVPTVWVSPGSADIFNPKVLRSGMGAHFHIPALVQGDHETLAAQISKEKITLVGAVMDGKLLQHIRPPAERWALAVGSEARGLSAFWRSKLDAVATIPGYGEAESLNAAVAAGIILHYLCIQCRPA
ncbi:MAG: RNA methyltransferase [Fidelibacterota bacterium]|nr:MAG: RNA methyltransferase [Candidatus Neomarinimicrobiota bacterium]